MARQVAPSSFLQLQTASTIQEQIAALKRLKNDLIGHDQRKEACIQSGIVETLVELLDGASRAGGKRRRVSAAAVGRVSLIGHEHRDGMVDGILEHEGTQSDEERWNHEDELRLQCIIVVGSLAQGGLPYVRPLILGGIAQPLLSSLSPQDAPPSLILATLRALLVCVDTLDSELQLIDQDFGNVLANEIFSCASVAILADILSQVKTTRTIQQQQSLVLQIIIVACHSSQHQQALLNAGVLDILSARLAACIVDTGLARPTNGKTILELPPPPPREDLVHILEAIGTIINHSAYRCACFVYNPAIVAIFPSTKPLYVASNGHSPVRDDLAVKPPTDMPMTGIDELLPQLAPAYTKPQFKISSQWPPLATMADYHRADPKDLAQVPTAPPSVRTTSQEFGSQLVSWLLYMSRSCEGLERLMAVWLLVIIVRAKDKIFPDRSHTEAIPGRNRDRILASLLVPLIVSMIQDANNDIKARQGPNLGFSHLSLQRVQERAMLALGLLVEDSPALQRAAVDAGAIKLLCQVLKRTFDPVVDTRRPMWHPIPIARDLDLMADHGSTSMRLGPRGMCVDIVHALKRRSAAMEALANVGQIEDGFRKTMIDQGIVACMVASLTPYTDPSLASSLSSAEALDGKKGNPNIVLVAACRLARALSRSVNILRTSLIDGGLAKPILELLKYPHMEVKRQATNVTCNLLLQFSPMRDGLVKGGCVRILCEHVHSSDAELQIMSLWALKHLVSAAPTDLKTSCLEGLGVGWLIEVMRGGRGVSYHSPGIVGGKSIASRSLATANAAGERVDLLNSPDDDVMADMESISEDGLDEDEIVEADPLLHRHNSPDALTSSQKHKTRHTRLKLLRQEEQNPELVSWRHDIRIQHQALDFLRNLIGDAQASHYEMIDYVFRTLPRDTLFPILLEKMRAGSPLPQSQQSSAGTNAQFHADRELPRVANMPPHVPKPGGIPSVAAKHLQVPSDLLISTIFILVHIANGRSQQRQMLVAQKDLITATLALFGHPERQVRLACLWLMQNLLWLDSKAEADVASARQRARDLKLLGVDERVREALRDEDLDVHQRAKGVVEALDRLLGDEGHALGAVGEGSHAHGHARRASRDSARTQGGIGRVGVGLGGPGGTGPGRTWEH